MTMPQRRRLQLFCVVMVGLLLPACSQRAVPDRASSAQPAPVPQTATRSADTSTGYHALLVGVTDYRNPHVRRLQGPANDVDLMRRLLHDRFGFPEQAMVTLKASSDNAYRRPTRKNILAELDALAQRASKGDRIVVFLSGHGSRAPRTAGPQDSNPEALVGLFLPEDIGEWNSDVQKVDNAIEDHEIGDKCRAILDKGALLWLIVDSCHSGGIVRDQSRGIEDVSRDVPAEDLKIPHQLLAKAETGAGRSRGTEEVAAGFRLAIDHPNLAAVYACRSSEETFERQLPPDDPNGKPYGIFTYALCSVLTPAAGLKQAPAPLTCAELVRRIEVQYAAWGRDGRPVPLAEGKAREHF